MSQVKQRKVALMGFRSVGKSSLAIQFVQGQFVDSYDPTIENTFNKTIKVKNQEFELFVVDTAGQDEYSIFPTQYAVDIHGYVLVYSIDSMKSFEVVQVLYDKIVDLVGNPKVPVVLVGNKKDLENEREVTRAEGEKYAKDIKAVFLETSAKDNFCVTDMFQNIVLQIETLNGNMEGGNKKDGCIIA
eukprot:GFUD01032616.1.p1 GENE.GFUD01032616.1~~GFUD01032616.1.p1  ORF type:complete len:187 (-),score=53.96 GFUD01032616.1:155-715(-)